MDEEETPGRFANPQPPPLPVQEVSAAPGGALTNDDFRRYISTPRPASIVRDASKPSLSIERRPRKPRYAKVKDLIEKDRNPVRRQNGDAFLVNGVLAHLSRKYRDRAKERRENTKRDLDNPQITAISLEESYRTVAAPGIKPILDPAIRRRKIIEESKYLGGDISHTHLVKGLDYALLKKIRAEIAEHNEELDAVNSDEEVEETKDNDEPKSELAKNIVNLISSTRTRESYYSNSWRHRPNNVFSSGRLSYLVDLGKRSASLFEVLSNERSSHFPKHSLFEIPTSLVKGKADFVDNEVNAQGQTETSDLVISKLIDIWSVLLHGLRKGHHSPVEKCSKTMHPDANRPIFNEDELSTLAAHPRSLREYERQKKVFLCTTKKPEIVTDNDAEDMMRKVNEAIVTIGSRFPDEPNRSLKKSIATGDSYAECYPGTAAEQDVNVDSDDEVSIDNVEKAMSKDFDCRRNYSDRTNHQRDFVNRIRTRRPPQNSNAEKRKLDREWQQISRIIERRKRRDDQL
ncbi:hypothetical protein ACOME3_005725 [Neoechinorhynchus agilis]